MNRNTNLAKQVEDLNNISDGVKYLLGGYFEYANEIIVNRALPNLYDGLKTVNRRILYVLKDMQKKGFIKSSRLSGDVMAYHPHGDSSIYQACVLLTDKNGSLAFPLVKGQGYFGKVDVTDPPAQPRYTEVKLSSWAEEFFGEMDGINMIPNFDNTLAEPQLLPVSFPNVLVNSTSGIAIGFKSNIPSFNFNDVCDLVIEYIKDGYCHTVIAPDFVTGGYYVKDDKELLNIMKTGKGRVKLRGKSTVNGKEINVTEIPFGKTVQGLIKQINDKNIPAIRNAYDTDDFDHGSGFTVDCTAKNRTDEALYAMYKETDFQYSYSADITVIKDGHPVQLGVWQVIEDWVNWRKEVLTKEYTTRAEACKERMRESKAFMTVVNDKEKSDILVTIIKKEGKAAGVNYVRENFSREDIPEDLLSFVTTRGINLYHDGGKYAGEYEASLNELNRLNTALADLNTVIVNQMESLKRNYGSKLPRRTEVTDVDYVFDDNDSSVKEKYVDNTPCYFSFKNGFLRKLRFESGDSSASFEFEGTMSDTLIAFDNRGRLLRVYCKDLPINGVSDTGLYLPRYFGLNESDDYRITWIGRLTGEELMLLYKDGNVGFVDTSEWIGNNRNVKILEKGISPAVADKLGAVLTNIPDVLLVADEQGRLSIAHTCDIKHKDRTAKTRVFNLVKNTPIDSYACMTEAELMIYLNNASSYEGKLKPLGDGDLRGGVDVFNMMF